MRVKNDGLRAAHVKTVLTSQVRSASAYVSQNQKIDLNASECSMQGGRVAEGEKRVASLEGGRGVTTRRPLVVLLSPLPPQAAQRPPPSAKRPPLVPYISAGAAIPSSARPLARVRRVAAVNARRAVRVGSGEVSTGQA